MNYPLAAQALVTVPIQIAHIHAPPSLGPVTTFEYNLDSNDTFLGLQSYGAVVLWNVPGSAEAGDDPFNMDIDPVFALPPVGALTLATVPEQGDPMDIDAPAFALPPLDYSLTLDEPMEMALVSAPPPTITLAIELEPMEIEALVSNPLPTHALAVLDEDDPMDANCNQEVEPHLGTPNHTGDLVLYDPRVHDFIMPSLISEAHEEDEVVPYNWDNQGDDQPWELEDSGPSEEEGLGGELATLSLDSPFRLVSVGSESTTPSEDDRLHHDHHQADDRSDDDQPLEHVIESFRQLDLNDADCDQESTSESTSTEVVHDAGTTAAVTESRSFHLFSDLESAFDIKKFTYLSDVLIRKPSDLLFPSKCISEPDINADACPGSTHRLVERLGELGKKLSRKMAQRKEQEALKTPQRIMRSLKRGLRAKETPIDRKNSDRFELTPLPLTPDHTLTFADDPFELTPYSSLTPPRRGGVRYKTLFSDSAFSDLSADLPSPPPSPTLQWVNSRAKRQARGNAAVFGSPTASKIDAIRKDIPDLVSDSCFIRPNCVSPDFDSTDFYCPPSPCPESPSLQISPDKLLSDICNPSPPFDYTTSMHQSIYHQAVSPCIYDKTMRIREPDSIYVRPTASLILQPLFQASSHQDLFAQPDWVSPEIDVTEVDILVDVSPGREDNPVPPELHSPSPLATPKELASSLTTPQQEKKEAKIDKKSNDDPVFPGAYPTDGLENSYYLNPTFYPARSSSLLRWIVELVFGW